MNMMVGLVVVRSRLIARFAVTVVILRRRRGRTILREKPRSLPGVLHRETARRERFGDRIYKRGERSLGAVMHTATATTAQIIAGRTKTSAGDIPPATPKTSFKASFMYANGTKSRAAASHPSGFWFRKKPETYMSGKRMIVA